jgi:prepilin-type processing-associated H-X9-DG protein
MKQIALGIMQYTQDNDERLPIGHAGGTAQERLTTAWAMTIMPYVKSEQVFQCPSDATKGYDHDPTTGHPGFTDYAANIYVIPVIGPTETTVKLSQIQYPATAVLNMETRPASNYPYSTWHWINWAPTTLNNGYMRGVDPGNPKSDPTVKHLMGSNWSFVDGHVKWYAPSKVKDAVSADGTKYACGIAAPLSTYLSGPTGANSPNGIDPGLCIG